MADVVTPQPPVLANFNYNDIADGTGTVINYVWAGRLDDDTTFYKLGPEIVFSEYTEMITGTFNSSITAYSGGFNVPKVLNGDCIVSFYWYNQDGYGNYNIQLYHYRPSTDTSTQIGTTAARSQSGVSPDVGHRDQNIIFAADNVKFRRGDQLKLVVTIGISDGTGAISIDPMNSDGARIKPSEGHHANDLKIRLPFRIDR